MRAAVMDKLPDWLSWIMATIAAALTMMGYIHSNFTTTRETEAVEKRLERIESKIDRLIDVRAN